MIIWLLNYILGYVYVEIYGDKKERFINLCSRRQVPIWKVRDIKDGYGFYIYAREFKLLKEVAGKTKIKVRIKERYGLPFFLFKYRKRKAFFLGVITALLIVYIMSLFVWDISVEGNYSYTKYQIIDFLEENNIVHGMRKSKVDCEAIEKLVRNNYFDITWVSVEMTGTRIIVHLRENFDDVGGSQEDHSHIGEGIGYMLVADKSCIIESIITRTGVPMVKSGDIVEAGSVIIDGKYNIVGDYDELIRTEYVRADGDVYGYVTYPYNEEIKREYTLRTYTGEEKTYKKIRINNNQIDFGIFGIDFEEYDKIESEEQVSLSGDFYIPLYFSTVICREYVTSQVNYTDEELQAMAEKKISVYLENLSKKGIQIIENNVKIEIGVNSVMLAGEIRVLEKIGVLQPVPIVTEEMGESNE